MSVIARDCLILCPCQCSSEWVFHKFKTRFRTVWGCSYYMLSISLLGSCSISSPRISWYLHLLLKQLGYLTKGEKSVWNTEVNVMRGSVLRMKLMKQTACILTYEIFMKLWVFTWTLRGNIQSLEVDFREMQNSFTPLVHLTYPVLEFEPPFFPSHWNTYTRSSHFIFAIRNKLLNMWQKKLYSFADSYSSYEISCCLRHRIAYSNDPHHSKNLFSMWRREMISRSVI